MRYILFDYDFAKDNNYYWDGLNLLGKEDILQVICSRSDELQIRFKLSDVFCPAKLIISDSWEFVLQGISIKEIIVISTREKFLALQENPPDKTKIYRYASVSKYFSDSFRRERNEVLNNLVLEDSQKEQVSFWVRRAFCIKDSGRRKYKTHNRLQAIVKNSEQLTQIYQAVKPFL